MKMKRFLSVLLALLTVFTIVGNAVCAKAMNTETIQTGTAEAESTVTYSDGGFEYGIEDYDLNTLKVTGYYGDLAEGQDLVIPSKIDGMTVTCVEGVFGEKDGNFGQFILPSTVHTLRDLHVHGFSGTLEIPGTVTKGGDDICFYGPEKLIYNPKNTSFTSDTIFLCHEYNNSEPVYGWTDYSTPLREIVVGDNVEIFWFESCGRSAKEVHLADGVRYVSPGFAAVREDRPDLDVRRTDTVFYLKKFDTPEMRWISDMDYEDGGYYGETGKITSERALAIGLKNCRYYYTNKNEELPVEQIFFTGESNFMSFESFGLYVGWSGTFETCVCPLNTTDQSKIQWTSSNPSVATVVDGIVTAHKIGRATITATIAGKSASRDVYVRNIYINNTDNGVIADNLSGNIELPADKIDTAKSVVLELDATELDPSDWTQWGQLKKALEEAYQNLDCTDAFDIEVKLKNNNSTWKVQPLEGKRISIWMPVEDLVNISKGHLIHVKDDGTYEEIPFAAETVDGVFGIRFETSSFSSFLLVEGDSTAKIISQPKTAYAAVGKTAAVTVVAGGDGLTYEWYFKNAGAKNFAKATAYTGPVYSVKMDETRKDRSVYCVITDEYGNKVQTNTVYLRMAATITTQPKSTAASSGKSVTVSVSAAGDGLTYAWYYKNAGATAFSKSSVKSATYTTTMSSTVKDRQVYCVVTDKYGKTAKSDVVTLEMIEPPVIKTQPKTSYSKQGAAITVSVAAEGKDLTYAWYYKNPGDTKYSKSSVKGASYSTTMSAAVNGRQVYCVVTNKYGLSVKTSVASLRMAATITKQPVNTSAASGKTVKVSVSAVGNGLTYQWYYKNAGAKEYSKSSIATATYACTMNATTDGRQVYCVVKDQYGKTAKSNVVTLGMPVKISTQPKTTYAKSGATAKITVVADGDGLKYQWYIKNPGSTKYVKSSVTAASYSTKMNATVKDRMVYCVITDQYGNSVKTNSASMRMAATITAQPTSVTAANGSKASVTVQAAGDGLKYQWYYKNAGATKYSKSSVAGATYSTTMSSTVKGRQVYCVVTDKYGKTAKSNVVTMNMVSPSTHG